MCLYAQTRQAIVGTSLVYNTAAIMTEKYGSLIIFSAIVISDATESVVWAEWLRTSFKSNNSSIRHIMRNLSNLGKYEKCKKPDQRMRKAIAVKGLHVTVVGENFSYKQ